MNEGDYIRVYSISQRKYEGEVLEVTQNYFVLKDVVDKKNHLLPFSAVHDIEIVSMGVNTYD